MNPTQLRCLPFRSLLLLATTAFCGNAVQAQVLDVPLKFTYKGAIIARAYAGPSCVTAYTVPAGVSARITDFMLANYSNTTNALPYQYLCSSTTATCGGNFLTAYITAPAGSTLVNNYNSGLRLDPGTRLLACNDSALYGGPSNTAEWTFNGFTYTNP